ncbi:hypothetical protein GGF31_008084 [Allomyces arbusculus]|nr:hypothetical protein GGF31_008084 [Allomyces arbusculus]
MTLATSCLKLLAAVVALLVALAATNWSTLVRKKELWMPTRITRNLDKCSVLDASLFGCEDIVVHGDYAYLACGDPLAREGWYPPALKFNKTTDTTMKDALFAYHFETKTMTPLAIHGYSGDMTLHGLNVFMHPITDASATPTLSVFVVNHKRTGSCVDIYDHVVGSTDLHFVESVCDPLIRTPNAVAPISRKAFYVSNYLSGPEAEPKTIVLDMMLARRTSDIVFRGDDGTTRVVRQGLRGANGLAVSDDGMMLYMAESMSGEIHAYLRKPDNSLDLAAPPLWLSFFPDNLRLVPDGLAVAGPGAFVADGSGVPTVVAAIAQGKAREMYVDADGKLMHGASVAAVHWPSRTILVGGPVMKGVVACPWIEEGADEKKVGGEGAGEQGKEEL